MSGVTEIKKNQINYEWTIHNYKLNCCTNQEFICSPSFFSQKDSLEWFLQVYPSGSSVDSKEYVSVYLHLKSGSEHLKVHIELAICILKRSKLKAKMHIGNKIVKSGSILGWTKFMTKRDLTCDELLLNGNLTIMCEVEYCINDQISTTQKESAVTSSQEQLSIYDELGILLENQKFTDVVLVANNKEFHAHKAILAARSSVFAAMFEVNMKEKQENRAEIHYSSDTLNDMLQFMYTGKIKNFYENSANLLKIADQYDIKGLKITCENMLYDKLNLSNVIEFLILADTYNCHSLKGKIITFMITHKESVKDLPEFKAMTDSHPQLAINVLSAML